jgi:hypothetical protein
MRQHVPAADSIAQMRIVDAVYGSLRTTRPARVGGG